jgi:ABC-2 type transport system ATP-binding protein
VNQRAGDPPAISVTCVTKTYRYRTGLLRRRSVHREALRGVSLEVGAGELFGLLGPNGAGKTTMVKILSTLLLPTSGRATVLGRDVSTHASSVRPRIGFVLGGERGLYTRVSAYDNMRYFAILYGMPRALAERRIRALLDAVGLLGREHELVDRYSRGMRQRLHLARGLLHDPDVLFLDEPTIGLDPVAARELREIVQDLARSGKTIFLTTHYMFEADAICDRIGVIKDGLMLALGTPASLKRRERDLSVVEFEAVGATDRQVARLRELPQVASVAVRSMELTQFFTVQCRTPSELVAQLRDVMERVPFHSVQIREPTLEDAYVRLVSS